MPELMSEEEIGRLANRMAMLVSDTGEADNAGRAVGALARRLGISGGQIKAIFMAGMDAARARSSEVAEHESRMRALSDELEKTREALHRAEATARAAMRERDALRLESSHLHNVLDRRRAISGVRVLFGVVVLAGLAGGGWFAFYGPDLHLREDAAPPGGSPLYRSGVVHEANVAMRQTPDTTAPTVTMLPEGTHVVVRRTLWHNLQQWVEVEFDGKSGYVLSTEINLS